MRRTMANLTNVFYFSLEDQLPEKDLIPGEVFITGDFKNNLMGKKIKSKTCSLTL